MAAKTYTIAEGTKLGGAVVRAEKVKGDMAGLAQYAGSDVALADYMTAPLKAAIEVGAKLTDKGLRKKVLAVWNVTLKRVLQPLPLGADGQAQERTKEEKKAAPYLTFSVDGPNVVGFAWKTPEPKADEGEGEGEGGEGEGEMGDVSALADDALFQLVQKRMQESEAFAARMEELLATMA